MANIAKAFEEDMRSFNKSVNDKKSINKLIQELAGLCVEKSSKQNVIRLLIESYGDVKTLTVYAIRFKESVCVSSKDEECQKIKQLINKVKAL